MSSGIDILRAEQFSSARYLSVAFRVNVGACDTSYVHHSLSWVMYRKIPGVLSLSLSSSLFNTNILFLFVSCIQSNCRPW
jgi:hypothetical protein